jgi:parallel beta-helix repeat protein
MSLRRIGSRAVVVGLGVLAGLAAVVFAIPATAAASVTSLTSCTTIAVAGKYRLDRDVAPAHGGICITIEASNVTLILNGHTVKGPVNKDAIVVFGASAKILGPGTVTSTPHGSDIELFEGGNGIVRGVTVTGSEAGIFIDSAGNDVRGNVATDNEEGIGVFIGATDNRIIGNSATGNEIDLFDFNPTCDSNVWRGNEFGTANQSCIH